MTSGFVRRSPRARRCGAGRRLGRGEAADDVVERDGFGLVEVEDFFNHVLRFVRGVECEREHERRRGRLKQREEHPRAEDAGDHDRGHAHIEVHEDHAPGLEHAVHRARHGAVGAAHRERRASDAQEGGRRHAQDVRRERRHHGEVVQKLEHPRRGARRRKLDEGGYCAQIIV